MKTLKTIALLIFSTISVTVVFLIGFTFLIFCIENIKNSYVNFTISMLTMIGMNAAVVYIGLAYDKLNR